MCAQIKGKEYRCSIFGKDSKMGFLYGRAGGVRQRPRLGRRVRERICVFTLSLCWNKRREDFCWIIYGTFLGLNSSTFLQDFSHRAMAIVYTSFLQDSEFVAKPFRKSMWN